MVNDTLRVALVIPDLHVGGAERLLVDMVSTWQQKGESIEPYVYAFRDGPVRTELEAMGCRVSVLPVPQRINPLAAGWLARLFQRDRVQLVHLHLPRAGFYGRLAARTLRLPVLYTEHSIWERHEPLSRFFNKATYFLNTHVVAVSDAVVVSIRRHSGYPVTRLTRIYNGVRPRDDADRQTRKCMRQHLGFPNDVFIVGNIANLHPWKGHKFLLQALHNLVGEDFKVRCVMIGRDCGEEPALRRLANELDVQHHVHWLGYRPDARRLLAGFDIFVLPSLFEGLPVALIEAMDAGLPIVATRVGGNPELVIQGETGFLVTPGSAEELAMAISSLSKDPVKRARMGIAAKSRMRTEFTADQMAAKYAELYKTLIHQKIGPASNRRRPFRGFRNEPRWGS